MAERRASPRRPWRTVRFRVTAAALLAVLLLLAVTAVVLLRVQRSQLTDQVDDDLQAQVEQLATLVAAGDAPTALPDTGDDTLVQLLDPDGTVLVQSPELAEESAGPLLTPAPPADRGADDPDDDEDQDEPDVDVAVQAVTFDGDRYRAASTTVVGPDGPVAVVVARSAVDVEDSVDALTATLAAAVPLVSLLLATATWVLVGRTLRPVEAIRRQVAEIGVDALDRRVPEPGTHDEVERLARTMNEMLGRLEAGAAREQRFVSDASHELRTPLARMRVGLEVDAAHPATADPAATTAAVLADVIALQQLVDDLLQLAGTESAGSAEPPTAVDLDDVVLAEAAAVRASTDRRLDLSGVAAAQLVGQRRSLERVVRNLLDNAVRHARSTVVVTLEERAGTVVLTVADDGPGITPADRARVFDRFVRLDEARTGDRGGTGLGLAITRAVVLAHGGVITVDDAPTGGAAFRVVLPHEPPRP